MLNPFGLSGGCLAAVCLLAGVARAGILAPGQTRSAFHDDSITPLPAESQWKGELLAERSESFEFNGRNDVTGEPLFARGTFTSGVYRDAGTGGLAFLYALAEGPSNNVHDLEQVVISGLGSASVDLFVSNDDFNVTRSADGDSLTFTFDLETLNDDFLVRTDARAFDANGRFDVEMEFVSQGGNDGATFVAFRPAADDGGPGPTPVPLPPGAWAALVTAGAFGAAGWLRRRVRAVCQ